MMRCRLIGGPFHGTFADVAQTCELVTRIETEPYRFGEEEPRCTAKVHYYEPRIWRGYYGCEQRIYVHYQLTLDEATDLMRNT